MTTSIAISSDVIGSVALLSARALHVAPERRVAGRELLRLRQRHVAVGTRKAAQAAVMLDRRAERLADGRFLEVAVNGQADLIVTGDRDLLALHPFMGVGILSPAAYLAR